MKSLVQYVKESLFIKESGNAVKSNPIPAFITPLVYKEIEEKVKKFDSKIDMAPLGSLGKKTDDMFNGDIDIAINIPKREDLVEVLKQIFPDYEMNPRTTEEIASISYPYNIDGHSGNAQVDFMVTDNMKWAKWRYDSPDFRKGESKYKAQAKDWLIRCIVSAIPMKDAKTTYFDDGVTIKTKWKYTFNFKGVVKQLLDYCGKSGKPVKNPSRPKEFQEMIYNDPDDVMKFMFGDKVVPEDFKSVESIWKALHSEKWQWGKEALEQAEKSFYEDYVNGFKGKGIDLDPKDFPCTIYKA